MTDTRMAAKYRDLISDFVEGRRSTQDFETTFLELFKADTDQVAGPEFDVLQKVFFAIDDYVSDPELRAKVSGLDNDELRRRAKAAYAELYKG